MNELWTLLSPCLSGRFLFTENQGITVTIHQYAEAYIRDASMERLWIVCPCVLSEKERIRGLSVDDFSFGLGSLKGRDVALNAALHCPEKFVQDL